MKTSKIKQLDEKDEEVAVDCAQIVDSQLSLYI